MALAHIGQLSAFVYRDSSPHAAYISVGVMLRAVKTAVHALMAEISPWILSHTSANSIINRVTQNENIRRVPSPEICALADNFVCCVIDDNGAEGGEGAGAGLLVQSFICLVYLVR
jgi:hypothetical protein